MKPGSRRCTSRTHPFSSQCSYGTLSQEQEQVRSNCNFRFFSSFLNQVHPHLQTWLGRISYSGHWETQRRSIGLIPFNQCKETFPVWWCREAVAYQKKTGSHNYWKDMAEVRKIGNMAFWGEKGDLLCFSHSFLGPFQILLQILYPASCCSWPWSGARGRPCHRSSHQVLMVPIFRSNQSMSKRALSDQQHKRM